MLAALTTSGMLLTNWALAYLRRGAGLWCFALDRDSRLSACLCL